MIDADTPGELVRCAEAIAADPFCPRLFARAFAPESARAPLFLYSQVALRARAVGALDLVLALILDESREPCLRAAALAALDEIAAPLIAPIAALLRSGDAWTRYLVFLALRRIRCEPLVPSLLDCLDDERALADMWWHSRVSHEAAVTLHRAGGLETAPRQRLERWFADARARAASGSEGDRELAIVTLAECGDLDALALARQLAKPAELFDPYAELLARLEPPA